MNRKSLWTAAVLVLLAGMMLIGIPDVRAEDERTLDTNIQITAPEAGDTLLAGSTHEIKWNANDNLGIKVYYSSDGGTSWTLLSSVDLNATSYTWTVPTAMTNKGRIMVELNRLETHGFPVPTEITSKYYYNETGNFAITKAVYVVTDKINPIIPVNPVNMIPAAPSFLTAASSSNTTIDLNWTDNSSNENRFSIYRKAEGAANFTIIGDVGANITTYQDTGLITGTKYFYIVAAGTQ